jgi:hypothetical protein
MKIIAISREHSDKDKIALITEPPLTVQIFEAMKGLASMPALSAISLETDSGCLSIRCDRFNPELCAMLEHKLTEAEDVASGVAARKLAAAEQSEKELTLEAAAAGFGLPIV